MPMTKRWFPFLGFLLRVQLYTAKIWLPLWDSWIVFYDCNAILKRWNSWGVLMSILGYVAKGLAPAEHRIKMCQLATQDSPFVMVDPWEVSCPIPPGIKVWWIGFCKNELWFIEIKLTSLWNGEAGKAEQLSTHTHSAQPSGGCSQFSWLCSSR